MSSDKRYVLRAIPPGSGWALDLGGGLGVLRTELAQRGYGYANVDLRPEGRGAIVADAEQLPLRSSSFSLVVSSDTLEHFRRPAAALGEARRVLDDSGLLVIWVPFLHPFHGDDLYRYTPLGLRYMLGEAGFEVVRIDAPLSIFSLIGQAVAEMLRRLRLGALDRPVKRSAAWLDEHLRFLHRGQAFAAAYLVTARPMVSPS